MKGLAVVALIAGLEPAAARADALWITGTYGNEDGCAAITDSQKRSENLVILRSNNIERYEAQCDILNVASSSGGWAVLDVLCGGEGETWADRFVFQDDSDDRKTIRLILSPAGEPEELKRCD